MWISNEFLKTVYNSRPIHTHISFEPVHFLEFTHSSEAIASCVTLLSVTSWGTLWLFSKAAAFNIFTNHMKFPVCSHLWQHLSFPRLLVILGVMNWHLMWLWSEVFWWSKYWVLNEITGYLYIGKSEKETQRERYCGLWLALSPSKAWS